MGWKSFSQLFTPTREVSISDMSGMTIAIDAMTEIYRGALATKSVSALTDKNGRPTIHISVIITTIMEFVNNNVKQIWIFDHDQTPNTEFHNTAKLPELAKRRAKKDNAISSLKKLDLEDNAANDNVAVNVADNVADDSDDSEIEKEVFKHRNIAELNIKKRQTLEKQAFSVSAEMIADIKYILKCLHIDFMEAPKGFEGEGIASYLNKTGAADAVFSGDTDSIAYGAKTLFRRVPIKKVIYEYTFDNIIEQIKEKNDDIDEYDINLLIKCALIMGTDFCEKTPRVGPGTVLKKIEYIELTKEQKAAFNEFTKIPDMDTVKKSNINNIDNTYNRDTLIQWLVEERQFNAERIAKKLEPDIKNPKAIMRKKSKSTKSTKSTGDSSSSSSSSSSVKKEIERKSNGTNGTNGTNEGTTMPGVIRRKIIAGR